MSRRAWMGVACGLLCTVWSLARAQDGIPNFAPDGATAWIMDRSVGDDYLPPFAGVGPVTSDPQHPYVPNGRSEAPSFRVADLSHPMLKPWAVERMRKENEKVLAGEFAFTAKSTCWPGSVPGILLFQFEPMYIVQTQDVVYLIWEYDNQVRRVYMNRPHSQQVTPSWFGESVGHYEGDTLVVDTIGLKEHAYSFVDNYRTPHTAQLHVVERYRMIEGGKVLEVQFTADDPGTFNTPWSGRQRYDRNNGRPMIETICGENIGASYFDYELPPSPEDLTPDF